MAGGPCFGDHLPFLKNYALFNTTFEKRGSFRAKNNILVRVTGFWVRVIKKDYFRLTTRNTQLVTSSFNVTINMLYEINNKLLI